MTDQDVSAEIARPAPARAQALLALQSRAGNLAVSRLVAGQDVTDDSGVGGPDRPVAPSAPVPEEHEGFVAVTDRLDEAKKAATRHEPASTSAGKAQAAAKPPPQHKLGQAKAAKAVDMEAAKPNAFDKAAFIAAVNKALAAQAPKNLSEAMNYKESGKADAVKTQIMGQVGKSKDESAKPVTETKDKPPDLSVAVEKPVTPLGAPTPAGPVHPLGAREAMPPPAPPEQLDLSRGPLEVAEQMRQAQVTEEQLAESNEPEFTGALAAKKEADQHSATAPGAVRESEAATLAAAGPQAQQAGQTGSAAMTQERGQAMKQVAGHQSKAKAKDEAERAEVTTRVSSIFDTTKSDVDRILKELDAKVDKDFADGEKGVKEAFTTDLEARMDAYKDDRYSGLRGKARWVRDKFKGLPESAGQVYVAARATYESRMQTLIASIADTVATELNRAKARVAAGRAELATYVDGLPKKLKAVGGTAAETIGGQLDQLDSAVDDKGQELAEDLATKYTESRKAVDEEITAMQEANKGLIARVKDAVVGVIKVILELKDLLFNVLSRVAGAVGGIVAHPIRFLGTLVDGVKAGVSNFRDNIGKHLKEGLKTWLFGHLEGAGVELPDELDAQGVITMLLSIVGLTKDAILERIRRKVPEPVIAAVAKSVEFVQLVMDQGLAGIYHLVVAKIGDVAQTLRDKAEDFVITKIVHAGIMWVLSLLNPASAFIKACKAIIDIVGFFFGNLDRIREFVDSVLDSIENFIAGDASSAAKRIEDALGRTVPIILGFLANLLDLGDIGETIRSIVATVQKPVKKVVDGFITIALRTGARLVAMNKRMGRAPDAAPRPGLVKAAKPAPAGREDPARSDSVRAAARAAVIARVPQARSLEEVRAALAGIRSDLAGSGLLALRLGQPDASGERPIVAIASKPKTIAALDPWVSQSLKNLSGERTSVRARFTVTYESIPDTESAGLSFETIPVTARGRRTSDPEKAKSSRRVASARGGVVRHEAESKELVVFTSSSKVDPRYNSSHAEYHGARILESQGRIKGKAMALHIRLEGQSPCRSCAGDLIELARELKLAEPPVLDCSGASLYRPALVSNFPTWSALESELRGWTVIRGRTPKNVDVDISQHAHVHGL